MYEFVTGPLAWLAFGIFFIGIIVRLVLYVRGLDWIPASAGMTKNGLFRFFLRSHQNLEKLSAKRS